MSGPLAPGSDALRRLFLLDPEVTFLNHGSFGACPRPILDAQTAWRERLEREPVRFLGREIEALLDTARVELAAFVGARAEDVVFVPNASTGVNTVLRSLRLQPGDELLCTSHGYNACRNALDVMAERAGARVVEAVLPLPLASPEQVVEAVNAQVTARTRFALVDHVTSPTGTVLPVEALVKALQARGVEVMVDGAHAPGMLPLQLSSLDADYYTGNCHKWMCTPKGSAFLHVAERHQGKILPLTVGHGHNAQRTDKSRFRLEFDLMATQDPSPFLCVPAGIRFMREQVEGGWEGARAYDFALVREARALLVSELGLTPACPEGMLGTLCTFLLPDARGEGDRADVLGEKLFREHHVEVPLWSFPRAPSRVLRVSAQVYNRRADYERLVSALQPLL